MHIDFGDASFFIYSYDTRGYDAFHEQPLDLYHQHSYYELLAISDGTAYYVVEDRSVTFEKGHILLLPPNTPHYNCSSDVSFRRHGIRFNLNRMEGEAGCYAYFIQLLVHYKCMPFRISDTLMEQLPLLDGFSTEGSVMELCRFKSIAYSIFYQLFREMSTAANTAFVYHNMPKDRMYQLTDLVHDIRVPIPVIAQHMGYSERHTRRLIQQTFGKNITALRQGVMLAAAKKLITENPDIPLSEIISKSGFSGPAALHRAFMKYEKCSPGEYKKRKEKCNEVS